MSTSVKHHYIPKFFLDGFTNPEGVFYIYDKQVDRIKGKPFYPSSHFFQENRNSIQQDGTLDDTPEQLYGFVENRDKAIVKLIQGCSGVPMLNTEQMVALQHFLSNLFFRLPALDATFKRYMENAQFSSLLFKVLDKETGESAPVEIIEKLRKDEGFQKMYRPAIGSLMLAKSRFLFDHQNWGFAFREDGMGLLSDNPLVFDDLKTLDFFENSFVMPLSSRHKLVRVHKPIQNSFLTPQFSVLSEILMIHQAKRYVCGPSKEFLSHVVDLSKKCSNEQARELIFKEIKQ